MPDPFFDEDFQALIEELKLLSPEMEALLTAILYDAIQQATIFNAAIESHIKKMMLNGISEDIMKTTITLDLKEGGRLFGMLKNSIKSQVVEGINQSARLAQYESVEDGRLYTWVTVAGHRICEDCKQRSDISQYPPRTFEEWAEIGLPGAGWSICRAFCYCVLDPTGEISTNIEVPTESDIREFGA